MDNKENWPAIKIISLIPWFDDQPKSENKEQKPKEHLCYKEFHTMHISDTDSVNWVTAMEWERERKRENTNRVYADNTGICSWHVLNPGKNRVERKQTFVNTSLI